MYIDWHINNVCNYKCTYCGVVNVAHDEKPPPPSFVADCFDRIGKTLIINIAGGEPFLYPRFVALCKALTKHHYISMQTNLSTTNVYDFADKVDPAKVHFITASLHILEREKRANNVKNYCDRILYLQSRQFNVISDYVAYPSLLSRISQDFAFLRNAGVSKMEVVPFQGLYGGLHYPESYSETERSTITSLGIDCDDMAVLDDSNAFRSRLCTAGVKSFSLHSNGRFYRCNRSKRPYGDLFSGTLRPDLEPRPCPFTRCCCPYFGFLNVIETKAKDSETFSETLCEGAYRLGNRALSCLTNPSSSFKRLRTRLTQKMPMLNTRRR